MRRINLWILLELCFMGLLLFCVNHFFFSDTNSSEAYHVTMNRMVHQIAEGTPIDELDYEDDRIQRVFLVEPEEIPEELAKGRLNLQIYEVKHKYFGKFLWGVNMLQKRLQTEQDHLMELKKEQHTLLTSISHGIKTPVTNIMLYADSIQAGLVTGEEVQKSAVRIGENAQKINVLVKELLNSSSKAESEFNICLGQFYLKDYLAELENIYSERLKLLQIEFIVQLEKNLMMNSDEQALLTCAGNLIENAIKYGDGQRIELNIEAEEEMVLFRVLNTGEPIPRHELPHIFNSFWRGSNAKEKEGNGLGLYICRNYVRKLGGDLQAQCQEKITEFIMAVPIDSSKYQSNP